MNGDNVFQKSQNTILKYSNQVLSRTT